MELIPIAHLRTPFSEKFGIPFQSGVVLDVPAVIEFEPEYRNPDALRGLCEYSHLWVIWGFSKVQRQDWSPTVRPPRLGGNRRVGVFASRSPYRPNAIGLSSVRIERLELSPDPVIHITGADMLDGTPVYDIKPYLAFTDSHPQATGGFRQNRPALNVRIEPSLYARLPPEDALIVLELLRADPRPGYQHEPQRVYGMRYRGMDIRFCVEGKELTVIDVVFV